MIEPRALEGLPDPAGDTTAGLRDRTSTGESTGESTGTSTGTSTGAQGAPWETVTDSPPAFALLWTTGPDTTLDGVFRLLAMRLDAGGSWEVFDRTCDPFPETSPASDASTGSATPPILRGSGTAPRAPQRHPLPVESDDLPSGIQERLSIPKGLRRLQHSERDRGVFRTRLVRDSRVFRRIRRDLDEEPLACVALVQLSGRVEETGPVSGRGRQPGSVPEAGAQLPQGRVRPGGRSDVRLEGADSGLVP